MELFFIISGVLTEYTWKENNCFKEWFFGKLKRYYPFAFLACIVSLVIAAVYFLFTGLSLLSLNYDLPTIITSLTLTHTGWIVEFSPAINNPTWYLCVLTICYLWYFVLKSCFKKNINMKRGRFIFVTVLMIPACYLVTHGFSNVPFFRHADIRSYGSFFMGVSIFNGWRYCYENNKRRILNLIMIIFWILSVIGFLILGMSSWYVLTYLFFPAVVMTSLIIPQNNVELFKQLGAISFEVYLWHVPLYCTLLTIFSAKGMTIEHTYFSMICFCILTWVVSTGIYFLVERPLVKRMRRF